MSIKYFTNKPLLGLSEISDLLTNVDEQRVSTSVWQRPVGGDVIVYNYSIENGKRGKQFCFKIISLLHNTCHFHFICILCCCK
jgi:hypothetical protein